LKWAIEQECPWDSSECLRVCPEIQREELLLFIKSKEAELQE